MGWFEIIDFSVVQCLFSLYGVSGVIESLEEGDYNTMAGLVLSELETIPADGDTFTVEIGNLKIDVVSVVDHRIEKTIVAIIEKEIEETE